MATFSSGVKCFRSFLIRSLRYLNGRTLSPFPAEAGHSQQLALIAVGLQQLKSNSTGRLKQIDKLSDETTRLASEVQALSHQFHSSKLDYLGLVPAIRGLCREISEHQQVEIHFIEGNIPRFVPPDVSLALFRITQESLHNSLKYNRVRDFTVRIEGTGSHIESMISDCGAGFDLSEAQRGSGLRLISMRELILAVKGTLSIESQPMQGTQVRVRVPLDSTERAA